MEAIKINPLAQWAVAFEQVEAKSYDREKAIKLKTDELYDMISEDDFLKIDKIIRESCNLDGILFGSAEAGIRSILQREAEFIVDKEHKQIMKFGRY